MNIQSSRIPMQFCIGLDIGKLRDYSTFIVNERSSDSYGYVHHAVRYAHRFRLGVPYPRLAREVAGLVEQLPPLPLPPIVLADATGVGQAVTDLIIDQGLEPIAITLTGGSSWAWLPGGCVRLPKVELIGDLNVAMQTGRLAISDALPLAATIRQELNAYRLTLSDSGHETYGNDLTAPHDDLVIALALAVGGAEHPRPRTRVHFL